MDVALLPIGGTYTMDIREAVEVTLAIEPKAVVPMHRSKADPYQFKSEVEAVSGAAVVPLQTGEVYKLHGR